MRRGPLFCLDWLVCKAVDAMPSIVQILCDSMWSVAVVHEGLWHENRSLQMLHLIFYKTFLDLFLIYIFTGCPELCGSFWNKLCTSEYQVHWIFFQ